MPHTIHYKFTQRFSVPIKAAYKWCTSFSIKDFSLIGETNAKREIVHLTDNALILKDNFKTSKSCILKEKLVHLYPEKLAWTSTHLLGPNRLSQFIYEIKAENKETSYLIFTANHIEYQDNLDSKEVSLLAEKLCRADSDVWKRLSKAMNKEIGKVTK